MKTIGFTYCRDIEAARSYAAAIKHTFQEAGIRSNAKTEQ